MLRGFTAGALACAGFIVVVGTSACPAPGEGEGEGEGEGGGGEGEGEGGGEGEGEGSGAAFGDACVVSSDCASHSCTPFFPQPNVLHDFCTQNCAQNADCASVGAPAVCVNIGTGGICVPSCDGGTNAECDAALGGDGFCSVDGAGPGVNICLRTQGPHCAKEADCATGTNCQILAGAADSFYCIDDTISGQEPGAACDSTGFAAEEAQLVCQVDADCPGGVAKCVAPQGGAGGPSTCQLAAADSCAAFFCFEGSCSGACAVDADCPANNKCDFFDFSADPATPVLLGLCSPFSGSAAVCNKDADCTAGEHCGVTTTTTGDTVTVCRAADPGDVQIGEACGDDGQTLATIEPTEGCTTNLCADGNRCAAICDVDGDCGAGESCLKFPINNGDTSLGICIQGDRCAKNADCVAATEVCVGVATATAFDHICGQQFPGTLDGGATCDQTVNSGAALNAITCFADADCSAVVAGAVCNVAARTCIGPIAQLCENGCLPDSKCNEVCASDADCGAADRHCVGIEHVTNGHDPTITTDDEHAIGGICITLPGSFAACTKTADCATAGEVCQPVPSLVDGTVSGHCATPFPNGVAVGATGGDVGSTFAVCGEGICEDDNTADAISHGKCRALCAVNADCTAPATCQTVADALGPTQDVLVCK